MKGAFGLSERNGDKSRFGHERRKKILRRKRNRELCQAPSAPGPHLTARQKNKHVVPARKSTRVENNHESDRGKVGALANKCRVRTGWNTNVQNEH